MYALFVVLFSILRYPYTHMFYLYLLHIEKVLQFYKTTGVSESIGLIHDKSYLEDTAENKNFCLPKGQICIFRKHLK